MAAVMLQMIASFYSEYSVNNLFISGNTKKTYIVREKYCMAHHDAKVCFLPNSRYHIFLLGNAEESLQKLNPLCFTYQHVDCLYTLLKFWFSGTTVVESGHVFENVQRAVYFNRRNAQERKKETLEEKI